MPKTRVLIVEDSLVARRILRDIFAQDDEFEVVGAVADPYAAWDKIKETEPDVVTLDVELPKMDGLTFLKKLMSARPMPVVMVSVATERGSRTTIEALEVGAVDFVTKPKVGSASGVMALSEQLIEKVKMAARARLRSRAVITPPAAAALPVSSGNNASTPPGPVGTPNLLAVKPVPPPGPGRLGTYHKVVLIGASTGGTEALQEVLMGMPADCPGVLAVVHMPEGFTTSYATRLDRNCRMSVREARDGDAIIPGQVLLAPGGLHLELARAGGNYLARVRPGDPVSRHKPSVDVLFRSGAAYGPNVVAAILTGMGNDGAAGMDELHEAGGMTVAQNEETCVVFGMPREAIARGGVDEILPLDKIAGKLMQLARERPHVPAR